MDNMPEIVELNDIGNEKITINDSSTPKPKVNFGGGIELLMNDKKRGDGNQTAQNDMGLNDINNLENELNNLSVETNIGGEKRESRSNIFSNAINNIGGGGGSEETIKMDKDRVTFNNLNSENINIEPLTSIGKGTASTPHIDKETKTWDGYGKFNDVPLNPDKEIQSKPQLTPEELLREKFNYIKKLENLEKKGAVLSKKYNMDSPLSEMQGEYETIISEKERSNSVKFQGKMLMAAITGLEFLNNKFDPFDVKLEGWSEQINENINDYDEIFAELHEKYKSKAKMAPEIKLLFQLAGSGIMVHMTNTMFKSAMPGMDDIMRQNPELMQQFTSAAVNSMGDTNPGFGGFMNNVMGSGGRRSEPSHQAPPMQTMRPPPPPIPTQNAPRNAHINRPDMNTARGEPPEGVNISNNYENPNAPEKSMRRQPAESSMRPEMKGPSDIGNILNGLKTKQINIQQPKNETSSTISISELKELSNEKMGQSKNRKRSERNVISLDI
jgi:hypothetical protein